MIASFFNHLHAILRLNKKMKCQILVIYALIICGFCANFVVLRSASDLNQFSDVPNQTSNGTLKPLPELNIDVIIAIIDAMDFPTLLKLAQTNRVYFDLCEHSFRKRNAGQQIVIEYFAFSNPLKLDGAMDPYLENIVKQLPPSNDFHVYNSDKSIQFDDVNMALQTIRLFGKNIQRLQLSNHNVDTKVSQLILQYVNEYCSESLIELELRTSYEHGNLVKPFIKPFKRVERLLISRDFPSVKGNVIPMNETFPALQHLSIHTTEFSIDFKYFNCHFPHLKSLNISESNSLHEMLKMNPQIQTIQVETLRDGFVEQIISQPKIKHLIFEFFGWFPENKQFIIESVTNLTLKLAWTPLTNIRFPNLQQLEVHYFGHCNDKWIDFIGKQNTVKELHLINTRDMRDNDFYRLTSTMHHLEEVIINSEMGEPIDAVTIIKFIETHEHLRIFYLDTCADVDKDVLKSKFSQQWTINTHHNGLAFQRK